MTTYLIVLLLTKSRLWAASVLETGEALPSGGQSDDFVTVVSVSSSPEVSTWVGFATRVGRMEFMASTALWREFDRMIRAIGLR